MQLVPYAKSSADVQAIVTVLDQLSVGETASYGQLTEAIGRDIISHRYLLENARDRLLKERKVFGCVHNVGIKRLSDSEIVAYSLDGFRRIRRMARKGAKKLASVQDYAALKDDEKARHNISMSVLGAIIHAATPKNMDRLNTQCVNVGKSGLPVASTLKMLAS